jgi:hypothetical protein
MYTFDRLLEKYSHKTNLITPPHYKVEDVKVPTHSPVPSKDVEDPKNLKHKFIMYNKKPEKSIKEIMEMSTQFGEKENKLDEDAPTIKPPKKTQKLSMLGNNIISFQEGSIMSKADTLLKRAQSFERLALYIDQRSFLQAIAQIQPFPPESNLGINAPYVDGTAPPVNNVLEEPSNHEEISSPIIRVPEQTVIGFDPIPENVQSMLNRIVTIEGLGMPISVDGEIGKETRNALNTFKKNFNVPAGFSDKEVFDAIKNIYNKNTDKYGK